MRKQGKINFPALPKHHHIIGRSKSLEDHDYVKPSPLPKPVNERDCLEMNEHYEEEKDKDYYFMDANLIGYRAQTFLTAIIG